MPLMRRTHRTAPRTTTRTTRGTPRHTTAARPSMKTRLLGGGRRTAHTRRAPATTTTTTTTTTKTTRHGAGVGHHTQKRHATMGDKVSGALMKLRGSLTRRPGLKAAGTRRMHGTDGRTTTRTRRHHL